MPVVLTMPSESGDGRCRFRLGRCIDVLSVPDTLRPELFSMEHFSAYSHSALPYRHVAVFRFSALGDVAMTVPVVYEVCRAYPGIRFTLFTKKTVAPLFVYPPDNLTVFAVSGNECTDFPVIRSRQLFLPKASLPSPLIVRFSAPI